MIRTQIQLTEEQARTVKRLARDRGISMAEVIRDFVDRGVVADVRSRVEAYKRVLSLAGRFPDRQRKKDVAVEHDRYLDQAFD